MEHAVQRPRTVSTTAGQRVQRGQRGQSSGGRWLAKAIGLYILIRMFLVFKSGLPQPQDFYAAVLFVLAVRPANLLWVAKAFRPYILFVAWVAIVNTSWAALRMEPRYFLHMSFQIFNLCMFAIVTSTRRKHREHFDLWAVRAVTAGAICEAVLITGWGEMVRAHGTFNNPNQLGYWAINLFGIYLVAQPKRSYWDLVALGPLVYIELATTSRAGLVAISVMVGIWLYELLRRNPNRYLYIAVMVIGFLGLASSTAMTSFITNMEFSESLEARFSKDSSVDEVGKRNTDRISHYPGYAILGAGEGDLTRFPHSLNTIEIHSTPMTVLFSYGIPGTILFWGFLFVLARRLSWSHRGIVAALIVYSITHQGMRFAYFWILVGMLASEQPNRKR